MTMRDMKALKELLAMDIEKLDALAPKLFQPNSISVVVSHLAPQYYNKQQHAQIKNFFNEQCGYAAVLPVQAAEEARMVVNAERSPQHGDEEEEERVIRRRRVTRESKSKNADKMVTRKRRRQSGEAGVAARNRPRKRTRKNNATPLSSSASRYILDPSTLKLSPYTPPLAPPPPPPSSDSYSPQDLPKEFCKKIIELNGTDIQFLMPKKIFPTDLKKNNDRLSMPINKLKCDFLTEEEKVELERRDSKNHLVGIEVTVFDPCLRDFNLKLKKWTMDTSDHYNLATHWIEVAEMNKLQKDNQLDIWSFRVEDKLCFMLHKLAQNANQQEKLKEDEV